MTIRKMIQLSAVALIALYSSVGCDLLGQAEEEGNDEVLALVALATAVVPPENCTGTTSTGGSGTYVFYTAAGTPQSIFTQYSESVDSTDDFIVMVQVTVGAGSKLVITDWGATTEDTDHVLTIAQNSGCPFNIQSNQLTKNTDYTEQNATTANRTVTFNQAGTYQIQFYNGNINNANGPGPDALPSSATRPTISIQ